eukprot:731135-Pelagomonas_calceolata.AAC.1
MCYCSEKLGGQFVDMQASCGCLEGQMDGKLKKEQIGTLFVWIGALEGGGWGWWVVRGASPRVWHSIHYFFYPPDKGMFALYMEVNNA